MTMRLLLVPMLAAAILTGGCSYDSFDKPIRLYPQRETSVLKPAPRTEVYAVAVKEADRPTRLWTEVEAVALHGDLLGFELIDGEAWAVVGDEAVWLGPLPERAEYIAWATQERRAGLTAQQAALPANVAGEVVGAVAVGVVYALTFGLLDEAVDTLRDECDLHERRRCRWCD
jgi:hypothetical protein